MRRSLRLLLWVGLLATACQIIVISRAWSRNAGKTAASPAAVPPLSHAAAAAPVPIRLELIFDAALALHWRTSESKDPVAANFKLDGAAFSGQFRLWGQGSRYLKHTKRRSFHLRVPAASPFRLRGGPPMTQALFLSLFEDQYRLAYYSAVNLLAPLGLWHAAAALVEVRCTQAAVAGSNPAHNVCGPEGSSTFGVYLAVEDPVDAIQRFALSSPPPSPCTALIHREVSSTAQPDPPPDGVLDVAYRWTDKNKVELLTNVPGVAGTEDATRSLPETYAELLQRREEWAQRLDVAQYLRWVAANTLLHNGDYIDEVFFYGTVPRKGAALHRPVLHLMGWDYDTILKPCHPVPLRYRLKRVDDSLIFCGESKLDHFMHANAEFRALYRQTLNCMLTHEITTQAWNAAVEAAEAELSIYVHDPAVARVTWEGGAVPDIHAGAAELKGLFGAHTQQLAAALRREGVTEPRDAEPAAAPTAAAALRAEVAPVDEGPPPEEKVPVYLSEKGHPFYPVTLDLPSLEALDALRKESPLRVVLQFVWKEEFEANLLRFTLGTERHTALFAPGPQRFRGLCVAESPAGPDVLQVTLAAAAPPAATVLVDPPQRLEGWLTLLLGPRRATKVLQDLTTGTQSAEVTPVMEPTFGFGGRWESFDDLFRLLRLLGLRTVVLRNHEELASNAQHPDVDLLSSNWTQSCFIITGRPSVCVVDRNRPMLRKVTAGARTASFDFTSVGDGYYCAAWQRDMLASRRRVGNGHEYNVLGPVHHFYSLLYHALYHKPKMAADYKVKLAGLAGGALPSSATQSLNMSDVHGLMLLLDRFMVNHSYQYTKPQNRFVAWQDQRTKAYNPQSFEEHLIILWAKARAFEAELLREVRARFSLQYLQPIEWQPHCFLASMHAFYGISLQFMEKKVVRCGDQPALLVVFRDYTPHYAPRRTSSGRKSVNVNVFDLKQDWRERLGQHYGLSQGNLLGRKFYMDCFHGTNNKKEITHGVARLGWVPRVHLQQGIHGTLPFWFQEWVDGFVWCAPNIPPGKLLGCVIPQEVVSFGTIPAGKFTETPPWVFVI